MSEKNAKYTARITYYYIALPLALASALVALAPVAIDAGIKAYEELKKKGVIK